MSNKKLRCTFDIAQVRKLKNTELQLKIKSNKLNHSFRGSVVEYWAMHGYIHDAHATTNWLSLHVAY